MALQNSTLGILPEDYFTKNKTLASNATPPPVPPAPRPLAKVASSGLQNSNAPDFVKDASAKSSVATAPAPIVTPISAPAPAPMTLQQSNAPDFVKNASSAQVPPVPAGASTQTLPTPSEAPAVAPIQRGLTREQMNNIPNQATPAPVVAPVPTMTEENRYNTKLSNMAKEQEKKAPEPVKQAVATTKPMTFEESFKPTEELYKQQRDMLSQDFVSSTQYKKDLLSQQLSELESQGAGVSNGLYRSLLRDQDANFSTANSAITQDYLKTKESALTAERTSERLKQDEINDKLYDTFTSMKDSAIAKDFAMGMAESNPDDPFWGKIANNESYWKAREKETNVEWKKTADEASRNAINTLERTDLVDSERKGQWMNFHKESLANPELTANTWSTSDSALEDLKKAYGEEVGQVTFDTLEDMSDEEKQKAYFDVAYNKAIDNKEQHQVESSTLKAMPQRDLKSETDLDVNFAKMVSGANPVLKGVIKFDGKDLNFDLSKFGMDGTIEGLDPATVPGLDIAYEDWDGVEYKEGYTKDKQSEWMGELDVIYNDYLKKFDSKGGTNKVMSRSEIKDTLVKDGELVEGASAEMLNTASKMKTSAGILEAVQKGTVDPMTMSNDQLRLLDSDLSLKGNVNTFGASMPASGVDIEDTDENFGLDKLNPPKIVNVNGNFFKLKEIKRVDAKRGSSLGSRLHYIYIDANGKEKTYGTRFIRYDKKIPSKTKNGIIIKGVK
jgi:hypothetical protein